MTLDDDGSDKAPFINRQCIGKHRVAQHNARQ